MRKIGAKASMPGFIEPQLATLRTKLPTGDYLHEIKFDGYRAQVHMLRGKPTIYTRSGHDWTRRFGPIVDALDYDASAILDGEIVVVEDNRTNFSLLQADLADGRKDRLSLYLFDILFLDGRDLRKEPLIERKAVLERLCRKFRPPVFYSQHFDVNAEDLFESARRMNLEGIVSKEEECALPFGSHRKLGEGEVHPEGPLSRRWLRSGCRRRLRAIPGQARRQGTGLHRKGRLGLLTQDFDVGTPEARSSGHARTEADTKGSQTEGELGGTQIPCRSRIPGHHY